MQERNASSALSSNVVIARRDRLHPAFSLVFHSFSSYSSPAFSTASQGQKERERKSERKRVRERERERELAAALMPCLMLTIVSSCASNVQTLSNHHKSASMQCLTLTKQSLPVLCPSPVLKTMQSQPPQEILDYAVSSSAHASETTK